MTAGNNQIIDFPCNLQIQTLMSMSSMLLLMQAINKQIQYVNLFKRNFPELSIYAECTVWLTQHMLSFTNMPLSKRKINKLRNLELKLLDTLWGWGGLDSEIVRRKV